MKVTVVDHVPVTSNSWYKDDATILDILRPLLLTTEDNNNDGGSSSSSCATIKSSSSSSSPVILNTMMTTTTKMMQSYPAIVSSNDLSTIVSRNNASILPSMRSFCVGSTSSSFNNTKKRKMAQMDSNLTVRDFLLQASSSPSSSSKSSTKPLFAGGKIVATTNDKIPFIHVDDVAAMDDDTKITKKKAKLAISTKEQKKKKKKSSHQHQDDCNKLQQQKNQFRLYQAEQWTDRYDDLINFRNEHGHCLVPHQYDENPQLSQWVKRQRYQYKLKQRGAHSTLSDERELELTRLGFVWNSHRAAWEERYSELHEYYQRHGHCDIPSSSIKHPGMSIWIKCQRRQYKLYCENDPSSNMTEERVTRLNAIGFIWNRAQRKRKIQQQEF